MSKAPLVFVFGIVLILGSCVPYGVAVHRAWNVELAHGQPLPVGETLTTPVINVDTQRQVQPALRVRIDTEQVEAEERFDETEYHARYQFPMHYEVLDEHGQRLYQDHIVIDGSGTRHDVHESATAHGARLRYEKRLAKVKAPPSGRIQLRVYIQPDDIYQARLESVQLVVYERVYNYGTLVAAGIALGFTGIVLAIAGLIAWVHANTAPRGPLPDGEGDTALSSPSSERSSAVDDTEVSSRRYAGLLHLSALASFLIPLGGLIAQLVLWLLKKDEDAFVAEHGKSALNFRLSMILYKLVAVGLIFTIIFAPFAILALMVLMLVDLIFVIIAAVAAFEGKPYTYPLAIRFL